MLLGLFFRAFHDIGNSVLVERGQETYEDGYASLKSYLEEKGHWPPDVTVVATDLRVEAGLKRSEVYQLNGALWTWLQMCLIKGKILHGWG